MCQTTYRAFEKLSHLILHQSWDVGDIINPILQMRKLKQEG